MKWLTTRQGRKSLYLTAAAAVPLLVLYGVIRPEAAPAWLELVAAILGIAAPVTALRNLPHREDDDVHAE